MTGGEAEDNSGNDKKIGFEQKPSVRSKWTIYHGKVVSVGANGNQGVGIVNEINSENGYVTLQPCAAMNSIGTKLTKMVNLPVTVPFAANMIMPLPKTLDETIEEFNDYKTKHQKETDK